MQELLFFPRDKHGRLKRPERPAIVPKAGPSTLEEDLAALDKAKAFLGAGLKNYDEARAAILAKYEAKEAAGGGSGPG